MVRTIEDMERARDYVGLVRALSDAPLGRPGASDSEEAERAQEALERLHDPRAVPLLLDLIRRCDQAQRKLLDSARRIEQRYLRDHPVFGRYGAVMAMGGSPAAREKQMADCHDTRMTSATWALAGIGAPDPIRAALGTGRSWWQRTVRRLFPLQSDVRSTLERALRMIEEAQKRPK